MDQIASIVIIDIRKFTETIDKLEQSDSFEKMAYRNNLARFFNTCTDTIESVCPRQCKYHYQFTGDGLVLTFFDSCHHALIAYFYTLVLLKELSSVTLECGIEYGLSVNSGKVSFMKLKNGQVNILSHAINVAARLEAFNNVFSPSRLIVGPSTMQIITNYLLEEELKRVGFTNFQQILTSAKCSKESKVEKLWGVMAQLNELIFLRYMSSVNIRGLDKPLHLYRFSQSKFKSYGSAILSEKKARLTKVFVERTESIIRILDESSHLKSSLDQASA
ncbi:hypothetical protein ACSLBF_16825 [Pseudoalteromonas sp. T1lg65]|uniref:hypothetical protein n=1 Tax=Pseudoalteromonas sp. T1lg65 TaxID=2077101 RepID=UPI003F7963E6